MSSIELIQPPQKVLIVKPSSLGDIIHGLPVLARLKARYPDAQVHWVVARGLEGLLERHPLIERLWVIEKDQWKRISRAASTASELVALWRGLKAERFDLVVDLQGLLRSGLITAATKASVRVGFKEAREGSRIFYTHAISASKDLHAVDRNLIIADALGCTGGPAQFPLNLKPFPVDAERYALLVPGAKWPTKRWPTSSFAQVASMLPISSYVIGGGGDEPLAAEIVAASNGKASSLCGKTSLQELLWLIKGASFVVTNDTGPMHMAAALGVPVVAVFGPTNPARTGPYGAGHRVLQAQLPCVPCFKRAGCAHMDCMSKVTPADVMAALKGIRLI